MADLGPTVLFNGSLCTCCRHAEEVLSNGVTVVFCGACEADTYITAAVKRMLEKGYNLVGVVKAGAGIFGGGFWIAACMHSLHI